MQVRFVKVVCPTVWAIAVSFCFSTSAYADVIDRFDQISGQPTGEFGWDDFSTYSGPNAPDQFAIGIGTASLLASPNPQPPGGIIQGNLYAFLSVPTWEISLSNLSTTLAFTSIAVQVATTADATGGNLASGNFQIGGNTPDEFIDLGERVTILGNGGAPSPVNFYWAEWTGLNASSDLTISVTGAGGFHQVFAGSKVTYFNTDSNDFDIVSIPEPGAASAFGVLLLLGVVRRRKRVSTLC